MSDVYLVRPDGEFLQRVLREGGSDLKSCFQCATCSVVCELSGERSPFPRKEMVWAQWGLKDRLVADPDIWLCHRCNDCSTKCPRGARPGDVLAALRQEAVQHYAFPKFLGRWANQAASLPLMLLIPAVLLVLALVLRDPLRSVEGLGAVLSFMDHEGFYADLYPHWLLIGFYTFFWGLAMLGALVGVLRFWRAMKASDEAAGRYAPTSGVFASLLRVLKSVFTHDKFGKCSTHASGRLTHLGAFYGTAALFVVSAWAVVALYLINPFVENDFHYPFALLNPWKILANLGAAALIAGCVLAIRDRLVKREESGASSSFDWLFAWLLLAVGVSGLLTELVRLAVDPGVYGDARGEWAGLQYVAYAIYFVHLVVVFDLLVYLPYSKFAHILYRTAALVYAEHSGRSEEAAAAA
jgi:quinone-modifying oxidoreductase subunit QmoC